MALLEPARRRRVPLSERPALSWCSWIIAIATVILAFCNADSARNWADGLTPSPVSQNLREFCDAWAQAAHTMRLSIGRDTVRAAWERRHAVDWKDVQASIEAMREKAVAVAAQLQHKAAQSARTTPHARN